MSHRGFSDRHGFRPPYREITIREDAPTKVRDAVIMLARQAEMTPHEMREDICAVLLETPDPNNWSNYPNIWNEVLSLIKRCPWYKVYDIAEALHWTLSEGGADVAEQYEDRLNQCFREHGIGWEMRDGKVVFRGEGTFSQTTKEAEESLKLSGRERAANEIREALKDISRRPEPDVTGSIQHAMAALEATARHITGRPNSTLGKLAGLLGLPSPLDSAVQKLWGFASERARHVREGQTVDTSEAELIVGVACAVCVFLSQRRPQTPF